MLRVYMAQINVEASCDDDVVTAITTKLARVYYIYIVS